MVIRRGGRQDVRFLRDMLHHAYYWREREPGEGPGPVSLYVKGWGRPGDTALIARFPPPLHAVSPHPQTIRTRAVVNVFDAQTDPPWPES